MLAVAGGGLAAAAVAGVPAYEQASKGGASRRGGHLPGQAGQTDEATLAAVDPSLAAIAPVQAFVSRPDLRPPAVTVTSYGPPATTSPPYIFVSVRNYLSAATSQSGLMILDRLGRLVWFKPVPNAPFDFSAQTFQKKPVLTWWQGKLLYDYGEGENEIADSTYTTWRTVQAGHGLKADLHEIVLTARGTALITAYQTEMVNLKSVGGPAKAPVIGGHVQEIDVMTGKVLFDWNSLGPIAYSESYWPVPKSGPYDYFHLNSADYLPDGNLIISAKNTWAIYKIDRGNGKVLWRMNGKHSNWKMGPGTNFYWQHDARPTGRDSISVFDDGDLGAGHPSQALLLNLNPRSQEVTLARAYRHPANFVAGSQGNVQLLPNGHVFVGWGNQNYFTEFAPDGEILLDGQLPNGCHSYRAYCQVWNGQPTAPPDAAAVLNPPGGAIVYASWNGATAVARWLVMAGSSPSKLSEVGWQPRTGFETAIAVSASGPYFSVVAVDVHGKQLGKSAPVKMVNP